MTTLAELPAGFADKVLSAQSTFRSVMDAMARPGSVQRIAAIAGTPRPMMPGTAAIALTLFDHDTPLWLDPAMSATPDATKWLKFHTSAPVVTDPSVSAFALVADAASLPALDRFAFGTPEYPDRSTTLILQVRKPYRRSCAATARTRHRWHGGAARRDQALGPVRAAFDQRHAVSARYRRGAGRRRCHRRDSPHHASCRPRETEACMSPSREANAPSRTRIGCWRMSAAAIATFRNCRCRKSPNSSASASIG